MARKLVSFTLDEKTINKLNEHSKATKVNKSQCVEMLINKHLGKDHNSDNISEMSIDDIAEKVAEILKKNK